MSVLDDAQRAFAAGDFAESRRLAAPLAQSGDKQAQQLLARTSVDPAVVGLTAGCLVLFLLIVLIWH